jgi:hypothetical protein
MFHIPLIDQIDEYRLRRKAMFEPFQRWTYLQIFDIIDEPVIALFDGLPLANHPYLRNLLIIDDVDNCADQYTVDKMRHGTSMASLISYGDLNHIEHITTRKIYVRPVLKPDASGNESASDSLLVDIIHKAVRRLF